MTVVSLAKVRADRLQRRIGDICELLAEAEDNDNDRRVAYLENEIRVALREWDQARLTNAAQTGRGGEE